MYINVEEFIEARKKVNFKSIVDKDYNGFFCENTTQLIKK